MPPPHLRYSSTVVFVGITTITIQELRLDVHSCQRFQTKRVGVMGEIEVAEHTLLIGNKNYDYYPGEREDDPSFPPLQDQK